jgi:hypothetical protein
MAGGLINLLITALLFCIVAYALYWVCIKFALPQPVMWICGAILLIVLLLWLTGQVAGPSLAPLRR